MNADLIFQHFPNLSDLQKNQIEQLYPLYEDWNSKINVISRKDIDQLYLRHVLHSLSISKLIQFEPETSILDIGTGGGFPGIPLAILFPRSTFHLVDSVGKKIKVVEEVAAAIELQNLTAKHERAEKVNGQFDFVVSRAVASTKMLFQWTHQKISARNNNKLENGYFLLKGGDLENEMKEFGRSYSSHNISEEFPDKFFETKKIIYIPK